MEGDRIARATARIEAATRRIEAAQRPRSADGDPELARRHQILRAETNQALVELDRLIESLER